MVVLAKVLPGGDWALQNGKHNRRRPASLVRIPRTRTAVHEKQVPRLQAQRFVLDHGIGKLMYLESIFLLQNKNS